MSQGRRPPRRVVAVGSQSADSVPAARPMTNCTTVPALLGVRRRQHGVEMLRSQRTESAQLSEYVRGKTMADAVSKPWYADGLRFTCAACGGCCTGPPGYVWVSREEISALAAAVGLGSEAEFEQVYVRNVGSNKSLREYPNGDCVFLDGQTRRCAVYEARPRQCRTWPFWDSNIGTPQDWQRTCTACPGSGVGRLYSLPEIESLRSLRFP